MDHWANRERTNVLHQCQCVILEVMCVFQAFVQCLGVSKFMSFLCVSMRPLRPQCFSVSSMFPCFWDVSVFHQCFSISLMSIKVSLFHQCFSISSMSIKVSLFHQCFRVSSVYCNYCVECINGSKQVRILKHKSRNTSSFMTW